MTERIRYALDPQFVSGPIRRKKVQDDPGNSYKTARRVVGILRQTLERDRAMRSRRSVVLALLFGIVTACSRDGAPTVPPPPPEPKPLLKDVVVDRLPSPYYHFEYDASGRANKASFASDFFMYDITYTGGRLVQMRNNTLGNTDRLLYAYAANGRVRTVT